MQPGAAPLLLSQNFFFLPQTGISVIVVVGLRAIRPEQRQCGAGGEIVTKEGRGELIARRREMRGNTKLGFSSPFCLCFRPSRCPPTGVDEPRKAISKIAGGVHGWQHRLVLGGLEMRIEKGAWETPRGRVPDRATQRLGSRSRSRNADQSSLLSVFLSSLRHRMLCVTCLTSNSRVAPISRPRCVNPGLFLLSLFSFLFRWSPFRRVFFSLSASVHERIFRSLGCTGISISHPVCISKTRANTTKQNMAQNRIDRKSVV